jgi:DNA-binding PadR family transcriptional regulator
MRRSAGAILPIEVSILSVAIELDGSGGSEFHGFEMARLLRDIDSARRLCAHGTLYKALNRMEKAGLLSSRWEDPQIAADEGRPRRRLYRVTASGQAAMVRLQAGTAARGRPEQGLAPA